MPLGLRTQFLEVFAREEEKILPSITSWGDTDFSFIQLGRRYLMVGKQDSIMNTEYTFTVSIQVNPKVAQGEYKPIVRVYTPIFDTMEPASGDSADYIVPEDQG